MKKFLHRLFDHYANIIQKTMIRTFCLFWSVILTLSTLSGCMWIPANQHTSKPSQLYDKTTTVTFSGALLSPNADVTIQAYDPQTKTWDDISKTTTDDYIWPADSGRYNWREHKVVPNKYWARDQECASTGESALVRSKWGGGYLVTFAVPDMWQCRSNNPDDDDFIANCKAPESPNVLLPSLDYRNFGKECADTINRLRSMEGKPPLQIDETEECGADSDAKCNYEYELAHADEPNVGHQCPGPGAQNECNYKGSAGSVDQILDSCIWQQMYIEEKQCYKDDPQDCYHCDQNPGCTSCECGHYVNMVLGNYTKVSCGVYEFQNNWGKWRYKAVMNFQ